MKLLKKNKDNPSLSEDLTFIVILAVGFLTCLVSSILICYSLQNPYFCIKPKCFSFFLKTYDFPIKAAAAFLTLAGFQALIFRSKQTKLQVDEIMNHNAFSNYLAHKKEFYEICDSFEKESDSVIEFESRTTLYRDLFPINNPQNISFDSDKLPELIDSVNAILKEWKDYENNKSQTITDDVIALILKTLNLIESYGIKIKGNVRHISPEYSEKYSYENIPINFSEALFYFTKFVETLMGFCMVNSPFQKIEYQTPSKFQFTSVALNYCYPNDRDPEEPPF